MTGDRARDRRVRGQRGGGDAYPHGVGSSVSVVSTLSRTAVSVTVPIILSLITCEPIVRGREAAILNGWSAIQVAGFLMAIPAPFGYAIPVTAHPSADEASSHGGGARDVEPPTVLTSISLSYQSTKDTK